MRGAAAVCLLLAAFGGRLSAGETVLSTAGLAAPLQSSGLSARATGLGGAYVGIAEGASSMYWNPAGLGLLKSGEWSFHHGSLFMNASQDSLILGWPLEDGGALGLGLDWVNYGSFSDRDSDGNETGSSTAQDLGIKVGYGATLGPIQWGLSGNYELLDLGGGLSYVSYAADLGALYNATQHWRLGISAMNLGYSSGGTGLASEIRLGSSYLFETSPSFSSMPAIAFSVEPGGNSRIQFGLEERLYSMLALRGGWQYSFSDYQVEGASGLSAGLGLRLGDLDFDYAYLPFGALGSSQRLSVAGHFDTKALAIALTPAEPAGDGPLALNQAFYVGASGGYAYYTNYNPSSAASAFNQPGFSSDVPPASGSIGSLWLGMQFESGLVIEAGGQLNPTRSFGYKFSAPSSSFQYRSSYGDVYAFALGGYRWVGGPSSLFMAGLRLGENLLGGTYTLKNTIMSISAESSGAFSYSSLGIGPLIRFERLLGSNCSLGLELGYDYAAFSQQSPGAASSGGGANIFDYSSVYGRLSLAGWFSRALKKQEGRSEFPMSPEMRQKISGSESLRQTAQSFADQGKQFEAVESFKQSVAVDPANHKAWLGLGSVYMTLGRKSDALAAYHKAMDLNPTDTELRAYVTRLEAQ